MLFVFVFLFRVRVMKVCLLERIGSFGLYRLVGKNVTFYIYSLKSILLYRTNICSIRLQKIKNMFLGLSFLLFIWVCMYYLFLHFIDNTIDYYNTYSHYTLFKYLPPGFDMMLSIIS